MLTLVLPSKSKSGYKSDSCSCKGEQGCAPTFVASYGARNAYSYEIIFIIKIWVAKNKGKIRTVTRVETARTPATPVRLSGDFCEASRSERH